MGNISAQTNSRISAKPKIRVLDHFKAQDLKIGSFVNRGRAKHYSVPHRII